MSSAGIAELELGAQGAAVVLGACQNLDEFLQSDDLSALCLLALRKMLLFWEAFQKWDEILQRYSLSALCLPSIWTILSLTPWKSCCSGRRSKNGTKSSRVIVCLHCVFPGSG
jgi:hypothetical protein